MTVESASYISQLDTTLPTAADLISEGDDHIRPGYITWVEHPARLAPDVDLVGPERLSQARRNVVFNGQTSGIGGYSNPLFRRPPSQDFAANRAFHRAVPANEQYAWRDNRRSLRQ